ncbi:MAG: agmatine deiminase family protein [Gemmatales bacterium]|nr:agmatine deiminase family protein [Gemmatales bacterium]MDW8221808.1 agmatine deiminase family protein [Gemmatales bacterium]
MSSGSQQYRWPAEWEAHAATWLAWPHHEEDWPGKFAPVPWVYAEIIRWLSQSETVHLLVPSEAHAHQARHILEQSGVAEHQVVLHQVPTNRCWTRDYAPLFVQEASGKKVALKWRFNGWAKYPDWQQDDAAGCAIARLSGVPMREVTYQGRAVVLEGGAVDSNGQGVLLTTEQCLLSEEQQRNPGFSRRDYEHLFSQWLGATSIVWLAGGISGDDTHGHVDDVARFVRADTVALVRPAGRHHPDFEVYQENLRRLKSASQAGRPLELVELPAPQPRIFRGQVLPASYANFYLANRVVLVPLYNDPADRIALNLLAELYPERQVVGIYCGDFILGLGAVHCATMQEPT